MSFKKFFLTNTADKFLVLKEVNTILYPKTYIRKNVSKNIFSIDDNDTLYHVSIRKSLKPKVGNSFISKRIVFYHRLSPHLKIHSFSNSYTLNSSKFFTNYLDIFKKINYKKNLSVLILNPIRGGYMGYSENVLGFIPKYLLNIKKKIRIPSNKSKIYEGVKNNNYSVKQSVNTFIKNNKYQKREMSTYSSTNSSHLINLIEHVSRAHFLFKKIKILNKKFKILISSDIGVEFDSSYSKIKKKKRSLENSLKTEIYFIKEKVRVCIKNEDDDSIAEFIETEDRDTEFNFLLKKLNAFLLYKKNVENSKNSKFLLYKMYRFYISLYKKFTFYIVKTLDKADENNNLPFKIRIKMQNIANNMLLNFYSTENNKNFIFVLFMLDNWTYYIKISNLKLIINEYLIEVFRLL
jgi:hypothetical protein